MGLCSKLRPNKSLLGFPSCCDTDCDRFIDISESKLDPRLPKPPVGDKDIFSTVARSSSTEADMGAEPLFSGFISTWILRSLSSSGKIANS